MDLRLPRGEGDEQDVVAQIYDKLLDHLDEYLENEAEVLASATPGQRAIYALLATDGEDNNGGVRGRWRVPARARALRAQPSRRVLPVMRQSGYSSFRHARGSSGGAFGVRSIRKLE
jgi:hypothetical protein